MGAFALAAGLMSAMPLSASAATQSDHNSAKRVDIPSSISVAKDAHKYKSGQYIVQLKDAPAATYAGGISGLAATKVAKGRQLNAKSSTVKKYTSFLKGRQSSVTSQLGIKPLYNYSLALNGFSAKLTATQVARLVKSSDVASVTPSRMLHITNDKSIDYLGITTPSTGTWAQLTAAGDKLGDGVVVGDLDTGIAPENKSFAGEPLGTEPGDEPYLSSPTTISYVKADGNTFTSDVVTGEQFDASDYSTKIIAGRYFVDGFGQDFIGNAADDKEYLSDRDGAGHGSHTASTAAGDANVAASVNGISYGTISGVAPEAKIASYKVCWTGNVPDTEDDDGCAESDIVAGIEAAVADGVDVLNFSIGGSAAQTTFSASDEAFLNAASAGIFVSAAAGNAGLGDQADDSSLDNAAPWETTVAASTFANPLGTLELGTGGMKYAGMAVIGTQVSGELVSASAHPGAGQKASDAALCITGSLDPSAIDGKIVVCDRGTALLVDKAAEVKRAGGIGMVLQNTPTSATTVFATSEVVPNIHLTASSYSAVHAYADHGNEVTLYPTDLTGSYPVAPVPQITTFSSHGPVLAAGSDVLKPDISAPGQFILAAVANAQGETGKYDFYDGTSMATPHITGLAALYLSKDPQASPAEIKSALMTTAVDTTKANGSDNEDPFAQGAGEVHPTSFLDPGLVYLADASDWKSYLVGTGQATFPGVTGIDGSDLNQASIAIGDLTKTQTVSRDVTALTAGTYTASIDVPGIDATVSPSTLTLAEGQTGHFTVTFSKTSAAFDAWTTGFLTWTSPDSNDVRSPVAIHPTSAIAPASIDGVGTSGSQKVSITSGFNGSLPITFDGLATGEITENDDDPTLPYTADGSKGDEFAYAHKIEPGTTFARFDLAPVTSTPGADLDLTVYYAADDAALNSGNWSLVGTSATPSASESVVVSSPKASGYYITDDAVFDAPADGVQFNDVSYIMSPSTNVDALTASPSSVPVKEGKQSSVTVSWDGLEPNHLYLGIVHYGTTDGAPSSFVTIVSSPDNIVPPTIGGDVEIGGTAVADPGTWNIDDSELTYAYQWTLDGAAIAGATDPTFDIPTSAFGKKLGLTVSASVGDQVPTAADATPVVVSGADGNAALTATVAPAIAGTPNVGSVLTTSAGTWNVPSEQLGFTYQWTANGTAIAGATASTFTATSAELGKAVGVTVTAKAGSITGTATAAPVLVKAVDGSGGLLNSGKPTITGTAVTGSTVTATDGTWNLPATQLTYSYQWTKNGDPIAGATNKSLKLPVSTGGERLGVTVTAHIGTEAVSASSSQVSVKWGARTTISLSDPSITTNVKEKVTVKVSADGSGKETGTVVVHYGSKRKTDVLHASDHGKIVVTLPKLKKGTYKVYAEYKGNSDVVGDDSITKKLTVRKAK